MGYASTYDPGSEPKPPFRQAALVHDMRPALPARATSGRLSAGQDISATDDLALLLVHLDGGPFGIRFGDNIREEIRVDAGGAVLVAAHSALRVRLSTPIRMLTLEFGEALLRSSPLPFSGRRRGHHAVRSGPLARLGGVVGAARLLAADMDAAGGGHAFRTALALAILEGLADDETLVETRAEVASEYTGAGIERALRLIEENLSVPISLEWLASEAGISPYHLSRSFRRITGLNIQGYLRERRLKEACRLLAETRRPLAEIAYDCGFSSQSRMTTVFRQMLDTTPLAYRNDCWRVEDARPVQAARG